MNIPTILIDTTVAEFKAEGYELAGCNIDAQKYNENEAQFITLSFKKEEDNKE